MVLTPTMQKENNIWGLHTAYWIETGAIGTTQYAIEEG
jgi:hypothetical protein